MSIKAVFESIKMDYCKANPVSYSQWDDLCAGVEEAYESGAKVEFMIDPKTTPKIKVTFEKKDT